MKQRYNIMLNPAIISKLDYHAAQLDISRSSLINKILFDCLIEFGDIPDQSEPELEDQITMQEVEE